MNGLSRKHCGNLLAFLAMLLTDDEKVFCRCYTYCTGHNTGAEVGHYVWLRMQSAYLKKKNQQIYQARLRNGYYEKQKREVK